MGGNTALVNILSLSLFFCQLRLIMYKFWGGCLYTYFKHSLNSAMESTMLVKVLLYVNAYIYWYNNGLHGF